MAMRGNNTRFKLSNTTTSQYYYLFDGTDDHIVTPITANGTTWSVEMMFNFNGLTEVELNDHVFAGAYTDASNYWYLKFTSTGIGLGVFWYKLVVGGSIITNSSHDAVLNDDLTIDSEWHQIKLLVGHNGLGLSASGQARLFIDYNEVVSWNVIPTTTITSQTLNIGRCNTAYSKAIKMRDFKFVSSTSANSFTYLMNESDGGGPYTGDTLDSLNSNDGTPTNITGSTFFNPATTTSTTFTNTSARTTYDKSAEEVEYPVWDQYKQQNDNKVGNRYTHTYEIFDFTEAQKTLLESYNAQIATFTQFYDSSNAVDCYCDIYYDPYTYKTALIRIVLTEININTNPEIEYLSDGYYKFDGVDDYVEIDSTFTTLGTKSTVAFMFNASSTWAGVPSYPFINYLSLSNSEYIQFYGASTIYYRKEISNTTTVVYAEGLSIPYDGNWHSVIVTIEHDNPVVTQRVRIYLDNVDVTTSGNDSTAVWEEGGTFGVGKTNMVFKEKIKNFMVFSDIISSDERDYFHNNNLENLTTTKKIWYPMGESVSDLGDSPYTDKIIDSSGNSNHGTPVNITPATFCNPLDINTWNIEDNIYPTSMFPRMTYSTNDYTFDSEDSKATTTEDVSFGNKIDSEMTSITGKFHRRYTTDADGNVIIDAGFTYRKYRLNLTEYNLLRVFDRQTIKFYPNYLDTNHYYNANCSIIFLNLNGNLNFDFAEIKIVCIGNLITV